MLDIILDALLFLLGRERKKTEETVELNLGENRPTEEQTAPAPPSGQDIGEKTHPAAGSVFRARPSPPAPGAVHCAACGRILKTDAVHEQGRTWCPKCYKTRFLNIKG